MYNLIVGTAGTGKSFLLREKAADDPHARLTASTGIAAINLGGACTINSLLGYFDTEDLTERWKQGKINKRLDWLWENGKLEHIYIDEVSMVSGNQLTILCKAIDIHNKTRRDSPLSLTLSGDFAQLPPIKEPFAFESKVWHEFEKNVLKLTEIRRQTDLDFVEALQNVRQGRPTKALEFFEPYMHKMTDSMFMGTTIKGKNIEVDHFNNMRIKKIKGEEIVLKTKRTGKQMAEWYKIPDEVVLRKGALIMILRNKKEDYGSQDFIYVNGDLAIYICGDNDVITVKLCRTDEEINIPITILEYKVPASVDKWGVEKGEKTIGQLQYIPVRVAFATTVHKSQSLTLDKVQVDFRNRFFTHPGMLYVALSRCRSPEGLRLVGKPTAFMQRCVFDPKIRKWL